MARLSIDPRTSAVFPASGCSPSGTLSARLLTGLTKGLGLITASVVLVVLQGLASQTSAIAAVTLTWDANGEGDLAGYRVYRSVTSLSYGGSLASTSAGVTTYQDTGVQAGTTYYWVVRAYDTSSNESGNSNEKSISVVAVPDVVGMPQTDAEGAIVAASLALGTVTTADHSSAAGTVLNQTPAVATAVASGRAVDLVVSSGPAGSGGGEGSGGSGDTGSASSTSSGGSSGGGGCFIATAAYGSPLAREIRTLRQFRDRFLLPSRPGQALVHAYYRLSPPLAELISSHDDLRAVTRTALTPVVWWADLALVSPLQAFLIGLGSLTVQFIGGLVVVRRLRRYLARCTPDPCGS